MSDEKPWHLYVFKIQGSMVITFNVVLICFILSKKRLRRINGNLFLMNLFASHIMEGIVAFLRSSILYSKPREPKIVSLAVHSFTATTIMSYLCIIPVTFDRLIAIKWPFTYAHLTNTKTLWINIIPWCVALFYGVFAYFSNVKSYIGDIITMVLTVCMYFGLIWANRSIYKIVRRQTNAIKKTCIELGICNAAIQYSPHEARRCKKELMSKEKLKDTEKAREQTLNLRCFQDISAKLQQQKLERRLSLPMLLSNTTTPYGSFLNKKDITNNNRQDSKSINTETKKDISNVVNVTAGNSIIQIHPQVNTDFPDQLDPTDIQNNHRILNTSQVNRTNDAQQYTAPNTCSNSAGTTDANAFVNAEDRKYTVRSYSLDLDVNRKKEKIPENTSTTRIIPKGKDISLHRLKTNDNDAGVSSNGQYDIPNVSKNFDLPINEQNNISYNLKNQRNDFKHSHLHRNVKNNSNYYGTDQQCCQQSTTNETDGNGITETVQNDNICVSQTDQTTIKRIWSRNLLPNSSNYNQMETSSRNTLPNSPRRNQSEMIDNESIKEDTSLSTVIPDENTSSSYKLSRNFHIFKRNCISPANCTEKMPGRNKLNIEKPTKSGAGKPLEHECSKTIETKHEEASSKRKRRKQLLIEAKCLRSAYICTGIVASFFIFWTPHALHDFFKVTKLAPSVVYSDSDLARATLVIAFCNGIVDPLIYIFLNKDLKTQLWKLIHKKRK